MSYGSIRRTLGYADRQYAGTATVSGVVKVTTVLTPGRRVLLVEPGSMRIVRETYSGVGGAFSFPSVATGREWLLMAFDHTGAYNAVVADRVMT